MHVKNRTILDFTHTKLKCAAKDRVLYYYREICRKICEKNKQKVNKAWESRIIHDLTLVYLNSVLPVIELCSTVGKHPEVIRKNRKRIMITQNNTEWSIVTPKKKH